MQRELVERARDGDHAAFAALVRAEGRRLYGIARRVTRDAALADDAVQEALIMAWRDLPKLRDTERFSSWLVQIVLRRCYAELGRTRAGAVTGQIGVAPDGSQDVADRDELDRGFGRLTPDHRAVLVLRYYGGLEPSEIGQVLGLPPGTVRSRLHYALAAMRSALEADARAPSLRSPAP